MAARLLGTQVHVSAVVSPQAVLGKRCVVGPFCVVGPGAVLGDAVRLHAHVVVAGRTEIGDRCEVYANAVVGGRPQDKKFAMHPVEEPGVLEIGSDCVIREQVTIHGGRYVVGRFGEGLARFCSFLIFSAAVALLALCCAQ